MTVFNRTLLVEDGIAKVRSDALGTNANLFGSADVGALVKLGADAHVQVAANDEIRGQVVSVAPHTVNDGFSFGSIKESHRIKAILGTDADTTAVAVGDLVVADAQPALKGPNSTDQNGNVGHVKKGTPAVHKWEVIWVSGAGAAGDTVILEKV